jgi:hypothetical protein
MCRRPLVDTFYMSYLELGGGQPHNATPILLSLENLFFSVARVMACSNSSSVNGVPCGVTCFDRPAMSIPLSCCESLFGSVGAEGTAVGWSEREAAGRNVSNVQHNAGKIREAYCLPCRRLGLCWQLRSSPYSSCSNYSPHHPAQCAVSSPSARVRLAADSPPDSALYLRPRSDSSSPRARKSHLAPRKSFSVPMRMRL